MILKINPGVLYQLFRIASKNPEETASLIGWLIPTAIETVILALVISVIAKLINRENDFEEWVYASAIIIGIIEVVLGITSLFA